METSCRPLSLPRLSNATSRIIHQLCSGRAFAELPCLTPTAEDPGAPESTSPQELWRLRWLPMGAAPAMRFAIHGRAGEEPFVLCLDDPAPLLPSGTSATPGLSAEILRTMPEALAAVVLECTLTTLFTRAEAFWGKPLRLEAVRFCDANGHAGEHAVPRNREDLKTDVFHFVLEKNSLQEQHDLHERSTRQVHGTLCLASEDIALGNIMRKVATWWQQDSVVSPLPLDLRLAVQPILQEFILSAKEFCTLRNNDFLVAPGSATEPLAVRCVLGKGCFIFGRLEKGRLSMEGELVTETAEPQPGVEQNEPDLGFSLANVPLRVSFALDTVDMTVGQLAAMRAGQVFVTACDPEAPVTVQVNGQTVGHGRLVDVSGRLAVQVTDCKLPLGEETAHS